MTNDPIQLLFEYIDLLEAALEASDPDRFLQLANKRRDLLPLLQRQRELIATLQNGREADQAHRLVDQAQITRLESEIALLRDELKAAKAEHRDRPNADRRS